MKISIITATFNSSKTLKETLDSISTQSYKNVEQIIIDGVSTDNSLEIVSKYPSIKKVISEPDKGIYDAMNKGVGHSTGEIICILNSDDLFYDANILSDVVATFKANPNIDAIYGNLVYFRTENPKKTVRFWKSKKYYSSFFDDGYAIPHPTLFVKKNIYDKVGTFNPDFKISSDYEFMIRAFKKNNYKPFFLDKTLIKMRMGGESTKNLKNIILGNKEIFQSWKMNNLKLPIFFYIKRLYYKSIQLIINESIN